MCMWFVVGYLLVGLLCSLLGMKQIPRKDFWIIFISNIPIAPIFIATVLVMCGWRWLNDLFRPKY